MEAQQELGERWEEGSELQPGEVQLAAPLGELRPAGPEALLRAEQVAAAQRLVVELPLEPRRIRPQQVAARRSTRSSKP